MKYVYFILKGNNGKQMFNRKDAEVAAKYFEGELYRLSYGYYQDCHGVFDAPTIRQIAEKININNK